MKVDKTTYYNILVSCPHCKLKWRTKLLGYTYADVEAGRRNYKHRCPKGRWPFRFKQCNITITGVAE